MANIIKPKRSNTATKVPTTTELVSGELGVNMADRKVYINNGTAVVQVGAGNLSGLGDVAITTPSNGQSLKYNSTTTKWENSTAGAGDVVGPASATDNALVRFDGTTGKLIQNSLGILDDSGNLDVASAKADYFDFDTTVVPADAVARVAWDDGYGTEKVGLKGGNVSLYEGQQLFVRAYNGSGTAMSKGQIVYIIGAQGNRVDVRLAKANAESTSANTIGMVAEAIAAGGEGFVQVSGSIPKLDTSTLTAGQALYLSPTTAGAYTATKPTAPDHLVVLGWVERVSATVGSIYLKVDNGYELDELHNVNISSPTGGQLLAYDQTSGYWKNITLTDGTGISVTETAGGAITVTNTAPDQTVVLTQGGATTITGTYPNFTISSVNTTYGAATSTVPGLIELGSDTQQTVAPNAVTATASRSYALQVNSAGQGVINVPWTDTVYSLPAATATVRGGIELGSDTAQTVAANAVTATASRTYALQINADGQGVVNVPWTDTVYTLPSATTTVLGGVKLGSDTAQTVAANAVSATASRSYAVQVNASGQAVVNVPWTDTNSGGTVTSITAGSFLTGGTITTTGTIAVDATSSNTASKVVARDASGNFSAGIITTAGRQENYGTTTDAGTIAGITGGTSGGTLAAPTQTLSGTSLYRISPLGYTGSAWTGGAKLDFVATENITSTNRGTNAVLWAIAAGGATATSLVWNGSTVIANGTTLTGNTGTVTSVGGTGTVSGLTLTGTVTASGNLTLGGTLSVAPSNFSSQTANTVLAAPNGAAGVPTFRAIVAADIPTLNQNTTGTAANVTGTVAIANGGTGATTAATARTNLGATTLGGNLYTLANVAAIAFPRFNADNTVSSLDAASFRTAIGAGTSSTTGTVTSVGGTGTVSGLTLTGTVTTSGNLTLGGTLAVTPSNFASQTANTVLAAPNGAAGAPTFRALVAADIPTLNQNTTGTAANVTGTVAIANGGTGQTTRQAALNALAGATTAAQFLRGNGTNVTMSAIQASDVPTLNQNTTGTASNVTGTVAVANGGTGATTAAGALTNLGALASTNPNYTGTLTGGTGVINIGSNQFYKDASGNIGIGGVPGSTTKFSVFSSFAATTSTTDLLVKRTAPANDSVGNSCCLQLNNATQDRGVMLQASPGGALQVWSYNGAALQWNKPFQVYGDGSDAMLYTSNGGSVVDLRAVNQANNTWRWMRIQEAGQLIVGSGSPDGGSKLTCSGRIYGYTGRDEAGYFVGCPDQSLGRVIRFPTGGYLEWTSNVGAIGTSYFNSDERLKKNIAPTQTTAREAIDAIEFKQFDWNEFTDQDGEHVDLGVIAQQLQQINPKFVNVMSDSTLGVNEPELVTYALKAIQELSAELAAVKQELAQLKGVA